jgi:hypothetical protein
MRLEKILKNFDLFGIETHPIPPNPYGLRAKRTSPNMADLPSNLFYGPGPPPNEKGQKAEDPRDSSHKPSTLLSFLHLIRIQDHPPAADTPNKNQPPTKPASTSPSRQTGREGNRERSAMGSFLSSLVTPPPAADDPNCAVVAAHSKATYDEQWAAHKSSSKLVSPSSFSAPVALPPALGAPGWI